MKDFYQTSPLLHSRIARHSFVKVIFVEKVIRGQSSRTKDQQVAHVFHRNHSLAGAGAKSERGLVQASDGSRAPRALGGPHSGQT